MLGNGFRWYDVERGRLTRSMIFCLHLELLWGCFGTLCLAMTGGDEGGGWCLSVKCPILERRCCQS